MIKTIENYDHFDVSFLAALGWTHSFSYLQPLMMSAGRSGSNAMRFGPYGWIQAPTVSRKCNTLVVGFCIGTIPADGPLNNPLDTYQQLLRWDGTGYAYIGPVFDIYFNYDTHCNFHVRLTLNRDTRQASVLCQTGTDGTGYPAITTAPKIPIPYGFSEYQFIEVYLDVTDFMNGRVKVAFNGKTYVDQSGIATAAYTAFGSDPYDDRAKLNNVRFTINRVSLLDSFYLCDDQGGYQDDFLGMVSMKPCYPVGDGVNNDWMAVENSEVMEAPDDHHLFIDDAVLAGGDENTYLQADQDLSREMFIFEQNPVPSDCTLIAVNSRTFARNVGAPGLPRMNSIVPLFQIQGNPIVETNSLALRHSGYDYFALDVYYPLVPGFALPWVEYLLEQSQFGFLLRTPESTQVAAEEILWGEFLSTLYDWDETIAEILGVLDDVSDSAADIAVWNVTVEDDFGITEAPDYGEFLLEETIAFAETFFGTVEGRANVCTGGTATALTNGGSSYLPEKAFDGNNSTDWRCAWVTYPYPTWLQYELGYTPQAPIEYRLTLAGPTYVPKSWKFQAAKVDGVWVTLDEQAGYEVANSTNIHNFPLAGWNPNETYIKFRLYITDGWYPYVANIQEMKIMVPWTEDLT